jgi:hypothetical protein
VPARELAVDVLRASYEAGVSDHAAIFVSLALAPVQWADWRPATCMPDGCFCEAVGTGSIRQPANTTSGLAFLPVAAVILVLASRRRRRTPRIRAGIPPIARPTYAAILTGATVLVGVGTAFYHASLSFWGQTADVLGMYLIATFLLLYNAARLWRVRERTAGTLYLLGNAVLLWGLVAMPGARRYVFGVLVLAVLGMELAIRARAAVIARTSYLLAAVGALVAGFALWALDITGIVCRPGAVLQGHAAWHLLGAAALLLAFMYYLSESMPEAPDRTRARLS